MNRKKILLTISFLVLFHQLWAQFICPPCGLSCDTLTFQSKGSCPHCQMGLILQINRLPNPLLSAYDGLYEYTDDDSLIIAHSPIDSLLYVIIEKTNYPLSFQQKDLFLNASEDTIQFQRDKSGIIYGYTINGEFFEKKSQPYQEPVMFPKKKFFGKPNSYMPKKPLSLNDGISTVPLSSAFVNNAPINTMVQKTIAGNYPNIHSILLYKKGKLALEEYFYGYGVDTLHQLRSATKTIIGTLIGIAIDQGYIKSEKDLLLPYFEAQYPVLARMDSLKKCITIEDFLTYEHGLACVNNNPQSPGNELSMMESDDWVKFTLDLPMVEAPGNHATYCTGTALALGKLLELATGENIESFAEKNLFTPLGIDQYKWRFAPDSSSREHFSQLYLRPRDLVKIASLYLNQGKWNSRQIISPDWIEKSFKQHNPEFGYMWRHKRFHLNGKTYKAMLATGNGGQKIYVWPAQDMVLVFTGGNYNYYSLYGKSTPPDEMIQQYILKSISP